VPISNCKHTKVKITKQIQLLFVICVFGMVSSCQNSTNNEQSIANVAGIETDSTGYEIVEQTLEKEQRGQFNVIEGKAVVFFMLNKKEFKDLLLQVGDSYRWDAEALFNNFSRQANTFQEALKKQR